jgi:hypothetical protein
MQSGPWIAGETLDSHLYEVRLDGERQPLAVRAHPGQGWVSVYRTNDAGDILHDHRGQAATELLYGRVELVLANRAPFSKPARPARKCEAD